MAFVSPTFLLPLALFCAVPHGLFRPSNAFENQTDAKADNETAFFENETNEENQRGESAEGFDPMVDDVFALLSERNETTVGITVEEEEEEEQLLLLCADQLSPFVPLLLVPPHYLSFDFSCYFNGNQSDKSVDLSPNNANANTDLFLKMSESCRSSESFRIAITSQPNCHFFVGFTDSLHKFPTNTLITKLSGKTMDGKEAVVRLVCGKELEQFNEGKGEGNAQKKSIGDEETFLKTLVIVEKTWLPGCMAIFFDSRTLDLQLDEMAKLLWKDGQPKWGTTDGNNKWAASKFLCGESDRVKFYEELIKMKGRNEKMGKGILIIDDGESEVRKVLLKKSDEELYCSEQVEKGFFRRIWDELFG